MGRLAKASEIMVAGLLLRSDPASEIITFSGRTWMQKPADPFIAQTGRGPGGRAHQQVAFASGAADRVCSKPSDLQLPDVATLIRVDDPYRAMR
jgi:hypothetical protein